MKKIPCIFYLYIHSKIYDWKKGQPLKNKEITAFLFEWRIPKKLRPLIIKELSLLGLIKKRGYIYFLEPPKLNEENINEYYEKLGMFENGK